MKVLFLDYENNGASENPEVRNRDLSRSHASEMVKDYQDNIMREGDTKSVWFDRRLIEEILKETSQSGEKVNGIRIYFSRYTQRVLDDYLDASQRVGMQGRVTTILVSTFEKDGVNQDMLPAGDSSSDGDNKVLVAGLNNITKSAYNFGTVCPAECGGTELP